MPSHKRDASKRPRIFLAAASALSPGARNLNEFLDVINQGRSVLTPRKSLNNLFLVGAPKFNFDHYKSWIDERKDPKHFATLNEKSGELIKFALGTCIDAIKSNPAIEDVMRTLDPRVAVFMATGLGDMSIQFQATKELQNGLFNWNSFWTNPERNEPYRKHLEGVKIDPNTPEEPKHFPADSFEYFEALKTWNAYWAPQSESLQEYLRELQEIESMPVQGEDIESAKLNLIRLKIKTRKELSLRYGFPTPPWESVSPQLLWNIPNLPAAQISMLLGMHGLALGYSGACASFGVVLEQAVNELESGRSDIVIVGAADITPTDELVSAFYSGRLAVIGEKPGIPFCDLRGTHISGGACVWILTTEDILNKYNLGHMGVEILGVGTSSDAEHIITPSKLGPKLAITRAFQKAHIEPKQIDMWDMHATGTPGDWNEFMLIEDFAPKNAYITARKGIFGHGMAVSGAWELTAQLLGSKRLQKNKFEIAPTGIPKESLNPKIAHLDRKIVYNKPLEVEFHTSTPICGKLSMGVGGVSSCVIAQLVE